jgi:hypothetical protein
VAALDRSEEIVAYCADVHCSASILHMIAELSVPAAIATVYGLYGLSFGDVPIIVVDSFGLVCGAVTLGVALRLRGGLLPPSRWNTCN